MAKGPYHIETSPLICRAFHTTDFLLYPLKTGGIERDQLHKMQEILNLLMHVPKWSNFKNLAANARFLKCV